MSARVLKRKGLCGYIEVATAPPPLAGVMQGPGADDPKWNPDTQPVSPFLQEQLSLLREPGASVLCAQSSQSVCLVGKEEVDIRGTGKRRWTSEGLLCPDPTGMRLI